MRVRCICGCGKWAANLHHVVTRAALRRRHAPVALDDPRGLVPVAFDCHQDHHNKARRLPLDRLPDAVFEFVAEALGPAGYDYLGRHYAGEDQRRDALLKAPRAARA